MLCGDAHRPRVQVHRADRTSSQPEPFWRLPRSGGETRTKATPAQCGCYLSRAVRFSVVVGGWHLAERAIERAFSAPIRHEDRRAAPPPGFALEGAASRQGFALSPDGSRMAFTAMDSSGRFSVFLRDLDSLETKLVRGSEGAHAIFWPPDGRSLYLPPRASFGGRRFRVTRTSYWPIRHHFSSPERG